MNIEIMPLVDLNSVHDEICDHDGCGYRPEIGISIYKRKRKDEVISEHINLYFCRNHYYQFKEQFLNKDNRLNKYYELLDKKEKEITCLNRKMVSGQELEDPEEVSVKSFGVNLLKNLSYNNLNFIYMYKNMLYQMV